MADEWDGLVEPQEVAYRSFDGLYIQGFLFLPPGMKPGSRHPALVMVHGGGTNSYLRTLNLNEQYMASKGYVVLAINYRGGSGFGREFQDLVINDWANGQARDAAAAADFMRALPYVTGKVGIYGYSYGGIMTMATIARDPESSTPPCRWRASTTSATPTPMPIGSARSSRNRSRRLAGGTQGGLRPQQHAGARPGRHDAAAHHARRGGRAGAVPPVSARRRDPEEDTARRSRAGATRTSRTASAIRQIASTCISAWRRSWTGI